MSDLKYAANYTTFHRPVARFGVLQLSYGQSPSGYGRKIATDYMVRFNDDPRKTLYRVYCCCFSNVGSLYVVRKGVDYYVREHELEAALESGGSKLA